MHALIARLRWLLRLRPRHAYTGAVRPLLLRALRVTPRPDADPDRVIILLSSAWGMGGTIRAGLNLAGWLARTRDVEIISPYRRYDEPFFGAFPPGVRATALVDSRPGHGLTGVDRLLHRLPSVLHRLPSVLFPRVDRLKRDYSLLTDVRLVRRLRGERGILIATRPGLNMLAARLRPPGLITVGLEQMNLGHHKQRLRGPMERLYPQLDAIVALTRGDADDYHAMLGDDFEVGVLPNTVRPLGGPEPDLSAKVAVAAGRLGPLGQKGFDLLLQAWAPVAQQHPEWRLKIFGEGSWRADLESLRDELGLADVVELPGATSDMGAAMGEASMFVLSSRFEGFPLILLEAMSKGLGVVAFDCPTGPADIIDDHHNGRIVPAQDVAALSAAILEMIEDEELRRRCGAAARATAERYTIEAIGPRWDAFLAKLRGTPVATPTDGRARVDDAADAVPAGRP